MLLQEEVDDELRGRVFSSLNTLVRLCVLVSMVVGPLLAALLGGLVGSLAGRLDRPSPPCTSRLPGVRLTLWLAGLIIISAGVLALHSVRAGQRSKAYRSGTHPSQRPAPGAAPAGRGGRVSARGRSIGTAGGSSPSRAARARGKSTQARPTGRRDSTRC